MNDAQIRPRIGLPWNPFAVPAEPLRVGEDDRAAGA
jgi:hypothetical protein